MRTRPIGSIIGAIAGLTFVQINADAVSASTLWRVVAVVGFAAIVWFVVPREPEVEHLAPRRAALRAYAISVTAMVAGIPVGAMIINNVLDRPNVVLPWVVFVVGAHFLPFAHAFDLPLFRWLAASLIIVSVIGAVATLVSDSAATAGWTGVAAGFVLLIFSALGPRWSQRSTTQLA